MTRPFACRHAAVETVPSREAPPSTEPIAGYTGGVKNGQHFVDTRRPLRPAPGRTRWAFGGLTLAALMALPHAAFAQAPPGDPGEVRVELDEETLERVRAAAEKAAQDVMSAAAQRPGRAAAAAPAKPEDKKALAPESRAQRAVVSIERGGQPIGLGSVLSNDGRILTALSTLGAGNDLDVRYADGHTSRVKLGHHDRAWDLALLVPQTGKWQEGLSASDRDPVGSDEVIRSFTAARGKLASVPMALKARTGLLGGDDKLLRNVIEIGSRVGSSDLGAPIIDEAGRVVGVVARGCAENGDKPCTPVAYGVPVSAIRSFLRNVPEDAVPPTAWLGIQGVPDATSFAKGVRVLGVHPESPADAAKIKGGDRIGGDLILAVDGAPVTSPEALAEAVRKHGVGDKVPLLLLSDGKYQLVDVTLRALPDVADAEPAAAEDPAPEAAAPVRAAPPPPRALRRPPNLPPLPRR
jgi:serine protease Do